MDYTNGGFFQNASSPNYYFCFHPTLFENNRNRALPQNLFINQNDTAFICSAASFNDFTLLLASFSEQNTYYIYFINNHRIIKRKVNNLSVKNTFATLADNGISVINMNERTLQDIVFKPNSIGKQTSQ